MPNIILPVDETIPEGGPLTRRRFRYALARYFLPIGISALLTQSECIIAGDIGRQWVERDGDEPLIQTMFDDWVIRLEVSTTTIASTLRALKDERLITTLSAGRGSRGRRQISIIGEEWLAWLRDPVESFRREQAEDERLMA
jgi:hypothetical protein